MNKYIHFLLVNKLFKLLIILKTDEKYCIKIIFYFLILFKLISNKIKYLFYKSYKVYSFFLNFRLKKIDKIDNYFFPKFPQTN